MPIAGLAIGVADFFADMAVQDEKKRRLMHAAIAAGIGAAFSPIDPTAAAVGAVLTAKELAGLAISDPKARGIMDTGGGVVAGAMGGSAIELAKTVGTAGAGAAVGYAADGEKGALDGLSIGGTLGSGNTDAITGKVIGAGAGGVIAAAAANKEQEHDAIVFGMRLGSSVGSNAAGLAADESTVAQNKALSKSFITGEEGSSSVEGIRQQAVMGLATDGAKIGFAGAVYATRNERDDRAVLSALECGSALGEAAGSAAGLARNVEVAGSTADVAKSSLETAGQGASAALTIARDSAEAKARALERKSNSVFDAVAANARRDLEAERNSAANLAQVDAGCSKVTGLAAAAFNERFEIHPYWKNRP